MKARPFLDHPPPGAEWVELREQLCGATVRDDSIFATDFDQHRLAIWETIVRSQRRLEGDFTPRDGVSCAWVGLTRGIKNYGLADRQGLSLREFAIKNAVMYIRQHAIHEHWRCSQATYQSACGRRDRGIGSVLMRPLLMADCALDEDGREPMLFERVTFDSTDHVEHEHAMALWKRLSRGLPPRMKRAAYMRYVEGAMLQEIAAEMEFSKERARQILVVALAKIRRNAGYATRGIA